MSLSAKLRRAPLRIATGAYILNTGVTKLSADDETAKSLHGMATGTYPFLGKVEPKTFSRALAAGEIAVGTTLLLPIVPPVVAGAALVGFSGALLNMYWRTPGMHHEGSLRPTSQGTPISKDVWMFGIGLGLMTDAALEGARDGVAEIEASVARRRAERGKRARRRSRRAKVADAEYMRHLMHRAEDASETAAKRLAEARAEYGPIAAEKARTAGEKARTAGDAARQAAEEYGPVAAERARAARDAARHAYEEYGPVTAEKMKTAGRTVEEYAARARERLTS